MKLLYSTKATATGGRDGKAVTDDGRLSVNLSMPKELGGAGVAGATNPEQLFAAGYAACFESAVRHVARLQKFNVTDLNVEATVSLTPAPTGFALLVGLHARSEGIDTPTLTALVEKAHAICPYSNAVKGNINVDLKVN